MRLRQTLTWFLSAFLIAMSAQNGFAQQTTQTASVQTAQQTPEQLQQLVAPIALYPDALVAQILGASTYPAQVVEADRWVQQHSNLERDALWTQVDQQQWDPSVKALTQFPTVLANLDKNITWTSGLGDAYTNQQPEVMNAVQVMRQRAQKAGNLNTTPEQNVVSQGSTIIIQPVNPEVVYVPEFDPWLAYGPSIVAYPGWYPYTGLYIGRPGIFFGEGFGMGYVGAFGWGWPNWGFDWAGRRVIYERNSYVSHSATFVNRHDFNHGGVGFNHGESFAPGHTDPNRGAGFHAAEPPHGFAQEHINPGTRSSAFSGFDHGGVARGYSARGQSSLGGGFRGGMGGGMRAGGGGHAGGGHR